MTMTMQAPTIGNEIPFGLEPEHAMAVLRAATLERRLTEPVGTDPVPVIEELVDVVWAGWERVHTVHLLGVYSFLLRHAATGLWTAVVWDHQDYSGQPYDFASWDELSIDERRVRVIDNTTMAMTGDTVVDLLDRVLATSDYGSPAWGTDPQVVAHTARHVDCQLREFAPAVARLVFTWDNEETAALRMLAGLGGFPVTAMIEKLEWDRILSTLSALARKALDDRLHANAWPVLHQGLGRSGRCVACTLSRRHASVTAFGIEVGDWDRDTDQPNPGFAAKVDGQLDTLAATWVDASLTAQSEGLNPTALVAAVVEQSTADGVGTFSDTIASAMPDWIQVAAHEFEWDPDEEPTTVSVWTTAGRVGVGVTDGESKVNARWSSMRPDNKMRQVADFFELRFLHSPALEDVLEWVNEQIDERPGIPASAVLAFVTSHLPPCM